MWCIAHRTDLVFSDMECAVSEIKHCHANVKVVAKFYRASGQRTKELQDISEKNKLKFRKFPEFFEVRFIEHFTNLCSVILCNLPAMKKHWEILSEEGERTEKSQAKGFARVWSCAKNNVHILVILMDVLHRVQILQKEGQRSYTTLPDMLYKKIK